MAQKPNSSRMTVLMAVTIGYFPLTTAAAVLPTKLFKTNRIGLQLQQIGRSLKGLNRNATGILAAMLRALQSC